MVMTGLTKTQEPMAITGRPTLISEQESSFQLQPQGPSARLGTLQIVSNVACEPFMGTFDGLAFEGNRTMCVTRGQFSAPKIKEIFPEAPVLLADIQWSQRGSSINVRQIHADTQGSWKR